MKLYTSSNNEIKATKIQSLKNIEDVENYWTPIPLSIDGTAFVGYKSVDGEDSQQYRFKWADKWYKVQAADVKELPLHEQSVFFTTPSEAFVNAPKEVEAPVLKGPFITLTQAPGVKGLFVGTILRATAYPDKEGNVEVFFNHQMIQLTNDQYIMSAPSEIQSHFIMHSNGMIRVSGQGIKDESPFIAYLTKVENGEAYYKTYQGIPGITGVAEDREKHVPLSKVSVPTKEHILEAKVEEAKKLNYTINAFVETPLIKNAKIKAFALDKANDLIVSITEENNTEHLVPIQAVTLTKGPYDVSSGVALASQVIERMPKIPDNVREDFFVTLKGWCETALKKQ